jgi:hypothetical protein
MKKLASWIAARRIGLALAAIVLGGFALRVWGVSAVYQRIEDIPAARQIFAIYQGYWSPDPLLFYPIFFNYIVGILLKLGSALLGLLGRNPSPGRYEFTLDQVLLVARLASAAMGTLTIPVVFKIVKRLFSETTALAAAAFFALSFVPIRDRPLFLRPDPPDRTMVPLSPGCLLRRDRGRDQVRRRVRHGLDRHRPFLEEPGDAQERPEDLLRPQARGRGRGEHPELLRRPPVCLLVVPVLRPRDEESGEPRP